MGILDYSAQNPWLSDALATISQGLLSYGSGNPNAMAQLPQYLAERQRYRRDDQRQAKLDERQNQIFQMQMEEQQRNANKRKAQEDAWMALSRGQSQSMTGGTNPAQRGLMSGAAPTMPRSGGLLDQFDPSVASYLDAYGKADPAGAMSILGEQLFKQPAGPNSSLAKAKADLDHGLITPEEYQAYVKKETYIAPQQPKEEPLLQVWDGTKMVYLPRSKAVGMPAAAPDNPDNPLGNSFDANAINFLTNGNPSDPMYAAVYNQMAQPKMTFDQATGRMVTITPDMSAYRRPTTQSTETQQPQLPPPSMRGVPAASAPTAQAPNGQTGGLKVDQVEVPKDIKDARSEAATLVSALKKFKQSAKSASTTEKVKSIAGLGTELNSSYNSAALLAKGDVLFKLGVLNGPDLDIIRRTITDPSTFSSALVSDKDVAAQTDLIINLINTRLNEFEKNNNLSPTKLDGGDDDPLGIR